MLNTVKKTKLELGARTQWCYVAVLHRAVRIDISDKEVCQQQHKRSEVSGEKIFQASGYLGNLGKKYFRHIEQ